MANNLNLDCVSALVEVDAVVAAAAAVPFSSEYRELLVEVAVAVPFSSFVLSISQSLLSSRVALGSTKLSSPSGTVRQAGSMCFL